MENNIVKFIKNEQNQTKLFLLNVYLYKEMKLIESPFCEYPMNYSERSQLSARIQLIDGFRVSKASFLDLSDIIDYKNLLIKKIDFLYNCRNLTDQDWESKIRPYINSKLEQYEFFKNREFCFFYWFCVYNYIMYKKMEFLVTNQYKNLYSVMVELLTNCSGEFERVLRHTTIFLCEDEYYKHLNPFDWKNKNEHHDFIINQWSLIINNSNLDVISYSKLVDINWIIKFVLRYLEKDKIIYDSVIDSMVYTEKGKLDSLKMILNFYIYNNRDRICLFCNRFKKAIAQVKYRGNEEKKTLNVQISNSSKSKLIKLISYYGMTQPKYIEKLIDEAYNKITK